MTRHSCHSQLFMQQRLPLLQKPLQMKIARCFEKAHYNRKKSKTLYTQAENLLLDTLNLKNFKPSTEAISIQSLQQSFGKTGRLDAECYQKKYEDYKKSIEKYQHGFLRIKDQFSLVKKISKKDKLTYHYTEIGDIDISDGKVNCNKIEKEDLPNNAKHLVKRGDLLISKVRPNRGAVGIVDIIKQNLIVSSAFTILREKEKNNYCHSVLKVLLRTKIYRDWMLQYNVGSQYPVIKDENILNLTIPNIEKETQQQITQLIQQSFALKTQSKHLLDVAKKAVEMAIETTEEKALAFINEQTALLNQK